MTVGMDITSQVNPASLFSSENLVIVISGGGTGIGLAFVSALVKTGARKVFILGRRPEVLDKAAKELDPSGAVVVPLPCDVADIESVKQAAEKVNNDVGYVDVLINNAGVSGPNHKAIYSADKIEHLQSILLGQWDDWEQTMAINTASVLGVSAAFLKLLDAANGRRGFATGKVGKEGGRERRKVDGVDPDDMRTAQIITISSIAGFNRHITAGFAYSSSKAGAISIGKALATLLAPWGIRSNVICPGCV